MAKKYMIISMDDERTDELSKILGSKTCKKILEFLSEKEEASEKDISDAINIPINTMEYNLNKLIKTNLVEKTKNFFWSKKGRKINMYKISNKQILISPKSKVTEKLKHILPVVFLVGIGAAIVRQSLIPKDKVLAETSKMAATYSSTATPLIHSPAWIWFFIGAIFTILFFGLLNWKRLS